MTTFGSFIKKNYLALAITVFGLLGFIAAFTLSVEKIEIIKNPSHVPSCTVNAMFNCATVMKTPYAEMFGFPNSFMGVAGYALAFLAGIFFFEYRKMSKFLTWFTTILTFLAFCISYYWLYLSAYVIGVFCPWCLVSTVSATVIFFSILTLHLSENNFRLADSKHAKILAMIKGGWNTGLVIIWFILAIAFAAFPFVLARF